MNLLADHDSERSPSGALPGHEYTHTHKNTHTHTRTHKETHTAQHGTDAHTKTHAQDTQKVKTHRTTTTDKRTK